MMSRPRNLDGGESCLDLLSGVNCSRSWHEEYRPFTQISLGIFTSYNVVLLAYTTYMVVRNWSSLDGKEQQGVKPKLIFPKQLNIFILVSSMLQEFGHIVFFLLLQGIKYTFQEEAEDNRSKRLLAYVSCVAYTLAITAAFASILGITILFQRILSSPFVSITNSNIFPCIPFGFLVVTNLKELLCSIVPLAVILVVLIICLISGVFDTPVEFLRSFVGVMALPFILQGIILGITGRRIIQVISDLLQHLKASPSEPVKCRAKMYEAFLFKIRLFVIGTSGIMLGLSVTSVAVASVNLFANPKSFLIFISFYNINFAVLGTLPVVLLNNEKKNIAADEASIISDGQRDIFQYVRSNELNDLQAPEP